MGGGRTRVHAGNVREVVVYLRSGKIDFHTSLGVFRYDLEQVGLRPGDFTASVSVSRGNAQFTLDPSALTGAGTFTYRLRHDMPNPSTFFAGQTSVPFRILSEEVPAPEEGNEPAPAASNAIGLTPEEAQRRCEANDLPGIKVFPFRGTRAGAAPISAWREGEDIVVKLPVYVLGNDDFRGQTRTLPADAFTSGVRLKPNELVRVHTYEPKWYHLNITGSTSGDIENEFCVTGEQMLRIAEASTTATKANVALTVVESATFFVPVGRVVQMISKPAARWLGIGATAGMLGVGRVAPTAFAGAASRAAVTFVEEQTVSKVGGRTLTQTVSRYAVEAAPEGIAQTAPRATAQAVPRVGSGVAGPTIGYGATATAADIGVDAVFDATFSQTPVGAQGAYQTTQALARGNAGERLAAEALAKDGHTILSYKPDITGTNQGGIDMITRHNGVLHLIDNKALSRAGNVSSVSALTTNFARNVATARAELAAATADPARSAAERAIFQQAVADIDSGNFVRVVTNANISPDSQVPTGVTAALAAQGIRFLNVRP